MTINYGRPKFLEVLYITEQKLYIILRDDRGEERNRWMLASSILFRIFMVSLE